jgi:serine/threonine-protein kinase
MIPADPNALGDSRRQQLVEFDEALRLGRPHDADLPVDAALQGTQDFLVFLHSVWRRPAKKIGSYTLIRNLGSGSIGPAYLVEEPRTKKLLVLRILWPDLHSNPVLQRRILADAKAAQLLRHSGILGIRQVRVTGSVCMFLSTYDEGLSLAEWRRANAAPISWEVAVAFIAKLADILEQAHTQGFTHGNLKPSNIFLPPDQVITPSHLHRAAVRVGEIGLGRSVLQSPRMSQNCLPWPMPHYLAPEQLARSEKSATPASDLYALGVLLYELLTNRSPVHGAGRDEIFQQTRDVTPTPPHQYCPEISEDVSDLVMKCLSKQPQRRHGSAKLLADACRALLPGAIEPKATASWWRRWLV